MYGTINLNKIDEIFNNKGLILIVIYEKHGNCYKIARTKEGFFNYFLELLKVRKEYGYFENPEKPKSPSITREIFSSLPDGPTKETASEELNRYVKEFDYYKQTLLEWDTVEKAIKESNGKIAYCILKSRSDRDFEYEKMLIDDVDIV